MTAKIIDLVAYRAAKRRAERTAEELGLQDFPPCTVSLNEIAEARGTCPKWLQDMADYRAPPSHAWED